MNFAFVCDAEILIIIVPAKAGTQCLLTEVAGFPPSRERRKFIEGIHSFR